MTKHKPAEPEEPQRRYFWKLPLPETVDEFLQIVQKNLSEVFNEYELETDLEEKSLYRGTLFWGVSPGDNVIQDSLAVFWKYDEQPLRDSWNYRYENFRDFWVNHYVEYHGIVLYDLLQKLAKAPDLKKLDKLCEKAQKSFLERLK